MTFCKVKIRDLKECCGKCRICMELTEARRSTTDKVKKAYLTALFAVHRTTFMEERLVYSNHRLLGRLDSGNFLSIILDGMAQVPPVLNCLLIFDPTLYRITACYHITVIAFLSRGTTNNTCRGSSTITRVQQYTEHLIIYTTVQI